MARGAGDPAMVPITNRRSVKSILGVPFRKRRYSYARHPACYLPRAGAFILAITERRNGDPRPDPILETLRPRDPLSLPPRPSRLEKAAVKTKGE